MSTLPEPAAVPVVDLGGGEPPPALPASGPLVLRGAVSRWPVVVSSDTARSARAYLSRFDNGRPVETIFGPPDIGGRFFYNDALTGVNFEKKSVALSDSLRELTEHADGDGARTVYVQSVPTGTVLPGFDRENRSELVPPGVEPRIWIGGRLTVQTHYDLSHNVACCVAGRRRFLLFPPDQLGNLYPGPFQLTLAGPPVSMVRPDDPDLERYPRFAEAMKHALVAELEPGDAIFIPYAWWHHVMSTAPFNILVNYWWKDGDGLGSPYDAMLHAVLAFRDMPEAERAVWRNMLDHYVFCENGSPTEHLPPHARGPLGEMDEGARSRAWAALASGVMREAVKRNGPPPGRPPAPQRPAARTSWHMSSNPPGTGPR